MPRLFPLVTFDQISLEKANRCLVDWGHKMGAINRPMGRTICHGLIHNDEPVAVTTTSPLITPTVAGRSDLTRLETIELSRLCSCSPHLCRVALRLWREFVFRPMTHKFAISYQDASLHNGNTYRFDGWKEVGKSRSGTDRRSGRTGRSKVIWCFEK